jgi:hypothetical protein
MVKRSTLTRGIKQHFEIRITDADYPSHNLSHFLAYELLFRVVSIFVLL